MLQAKEEKAAAEARRAYLQEWRRKNPDKVRKYNKSYWERRAQRKQEGQHSETVNNL